MGSEQLSKDWSHQYFRPSQSQTTAIILQHKYTLQKFELIPISTNDEPEKMKLRQRIKNRQTVKPTFIRHLQDIYFKQEDQLCGSMNKFQLIYEFAQSRLQQQFNYRKQKKLAFHDQEILYLLTNISQALNEIQKLKERHGQINMRSVLITRQLKLQDPVLIELGQSENLQTFEAKSVVYPSPNALLSRVDSGMNLDSFREDLFSLGMVALQLCFPGEDIRRVYKSKAKRYQNERIDFRLLYQYVRNIKNHVLKDCLSALLSQSPNQRTKIYKLLQNVDIQKNNLALINRNRKVITHEQQLANMLNPNKQVNPSQANYPRPYYSQSKTSNNPAEDYYKQRTNIKNINHLQFQIQYPKVAPSINFRIQPKPFSHRASTIANHLIPVLQNKSEVYEKKRVGFHYVQNQHLRASIPFQYQNMVVRQEINKSMHNNSNIAPQSMPNKNHEKEKMSMNKVVANFQIQQRQINQQDNKKEMTPIKNLAQFVQPCKQDFDKTAQKKDNKKNQRRGVKIKSSNQQLQAMQQQFAQLQKIASKNQELQKKLHFEANTLFNQKQKTPIHSDVIFQDTLEDSITEQAQLVLEEYQSGHKYEGYVENKKRNGFGKFYYEGGSIYQGEWVDNKMCGYGMLFYPNGNLAYQGFWNNDEFEGKGILKNDDFQSFEGNFDFKNLKNIKTFQWKLYDGQWHKDKRQGKGKLTLSNGQIYDGEFKNDIAHGQGTFRQQNGNKIRGLWVQGILTTLLE